jgi:DDE superfamily endonuclease
VRAEPVASATNAVLHPWLKRELAAILATCPAVVDPTAPGRHWSAWSYRDDPFGFNAKLPPLRVLLIWDNLKGHHTPALVDWCLERGIGLLYTPIAGSWLNMAESLQRILVRRALAGQHPTTAMQLMAWLAQAVRGWNAAPTPFEWGGKRAARRARARERRHRLGGSGACTQVPLRRPRPMATCTCKGYPHVK